MYLIVLGNEELSHDSVSSSFSFSSPTPSLGPRGWTSISYSGRRHGNRRWSFVRRALSPYGVHVHYLGISHEASLVLL